LFLLCWKPKPTNQVSLIAVVQHLHAAKPFEQFYNMIAVAGQGLAGCEACYAPILKKERQGCQKRQLASGQHCPRSA
jgi:hypothetical protein